MSETKTELNDIILSKSGGDFSSFKKILLAVATFAVLLIIVVVAMSTFTDNKGGLTNTLKNDQEMKIIPPEPDTITQSKSELFKPAVISSDEPTIVEAAPLDLEETVEQVTQSVPVFEEPVIEPAKEEKVTVVEDPYKEIEAPIVIKPVTTKAKVVVPVKKASSTKTIANKHYVQVGSFAKAKPNKKLIKKIKDNNFDYALKRVNVRGTMVTKLLIGPFDSYREARKAKEVIKQKIEAGAFIYKAQ